MPAQARRAREPRLEDRELGFDECRIRQPVSRSVCIHARGPVAVGFADRDMVAIPVTFAPGRSKLETGLNRIRTERKDYGDGRSMPPSQHKSRVVLLGIMTSTSSLASSVARSRSAVELPIAEAPDELNVATFDVTELLKPLLELTPPISHAGLGNRTEDADPGDAGGHLFASHLCKRHVLMPLRIDSIFAAAQHNGTSRIGLSMGWKRAVTWLSGFEVRHLRHATIWAQKCCNRL